MLDKLKIGLQYCAPKHALTRFMGKLAALEGGKVTIMVINWFIGQYNVNMSEALNSKPESYKTFNDFFVRELKYGARPIDEEPNTLSHPADACVSQFGSIKEDLLFQAKGHYFEICDLVGGDQTLADEFISGDFATLYLSPSDYHRVHMPCDGTLRQMIYIPGDLFSVNPLTAKNVPNLFARNERVVCVFDTEHGPFLQILVGATIVGSIETVWAGTITPPQGDAVRRWHYPCGGEEAITLKKGEEMGRFKLGSTVINLFPRNAVEFVEQMDLNVKTEMGQAYAKWKN